MSFGQQQHKSSLAVSQLKALAIKSSMIRTVNSAFIYMRKLSVIRKIISANWSLIDLLLFYHLRILFSLPILCKKKKNCFASREGSKEEKKLLRQIKISFDCFASIEHNSLLVSLIFVVICFFVSLDLIIHPWIVCNENAINIQRTINRQLLPTM